MNRWGVEERGAWLDPWELEQERSLQEGRGQVETPVSRETSSLHHLQRGPETTGQRSVRLSSCLHGAPRLTVGIGHTHTHTHTNTHTHTRLRRALRCWLSWTGQDRAAELSGEREKAEGASREFWALQEFRGEAESLLVPRSHMKAARLSAGGPLSQRSA